MTIDTAIQEVKHNIKAAQSRSPFAAKDVLLLAVTKTVEPERIQEAIEAGVCDLGENKVQEILAKYDALPTAKWHLIGHLQTNKVKYILDKVVMVHSLDRIELAKEINKRALALNIIMPVLVQVNIAEEDSKFGLKEGEVKDFLTAMADYKGLQVEGLMTIGPFLPDKEDLRPVFRSLRLLSQRMDSLNMPHISMKHLSMGMSNDYEVAVEEGATIIRVGSNIFGHRIYK
ncbi:MAG: YggS family pyridoxal phosphate-dependent enzyme [Bacillota bacterium]|jgi:pyridoxal phosphate enzyme (YggS family)